MATNTPKAMSSRLATMKFMQRSASKSAVATPDGPPAKKVRLSNGASTPSFAATPSDRSTFASPSAEDQKREEVLARAAEKAGETRWVLSLQDPQLGSRSPMMPVRQAGFGVIDADDDSDVEGDHVQPVRMQFGGGINKKKAVHDQTSHGQSDNDESESGSSEPEEYDPTDALIRETEREIKAKARNARNARNKRKNERSTPIRPAVIDEDMDLGSLTSLSGGGAGTRPSVVCHKCFEKGHIMANCPKLAQRRLEGRGHGRVRF